MKFSAIESDEKGKQQEGGAELRGAPRYTLLIRAAKLVCDQGEFLGVIRDVSSTGVAMRLFHPIPERGRFALELQSGEQFSVQCVRRSAHEAAFTFADNVVVDRFVSEVSEYPKRGLRLAICFPVTLRARGEVHDALVINISQQGARIECNAMLAIDQNITIDGEGLKGVRAKIRWRANGDYGLVFDDTFSLSEFAKLAAQLQAPALLED